MGHMLSVSLQSPPQWCSPLTDYREVTWIGQTGAQGEGREEEKEEGKGREGEKMVVGGRGWGGKGRGEEVWKLFFGRCFVLLCNITFSTQSSHGVSSVYIRRVKRGQINHPKLVLLASNREVYLLSGLWSF